MLKKKQSSKQIPAQGQSKRDKCSICKTINQKMQLFQIVDRSLIKKYSKLVSDSTNTSELNQFLFGLSVHYPGGIIQFQKQYCILKQYLTSYYPITKTKIFVTSLIKKTAKQFKNPYMHYYGPIYNILKKERLIKNNQFKLKDKFNNPTKADIINSSSNQFKNQRLVSNLKKNQKKIKDLNQSYKEMKTLCKKIGLMCNKVGSQVTNKKFKEHLQSLVNKRKEEKSKKQFRFPVDHNISMIKKQPSRGKLNSNKVSFSKEVDDIYGISGKRLRKNQFSEFKQEAEGQKPYSNKRASTQQGEIIYYSPSSRAYYDRQINYTQNAGKIKEKRKKISYFSISCKKLNRISERSKSKKKQTIEQKQELGRKNSNNKKKTK